MKKTILISLMFLLTGCQNNTPVENPFNEDTIEVTLPTEPLVETINEEEDTLEEQNEIEEPLIDEVDEVIIEPKVRNRDNLSRDDVLWLQESLKIAGYYTARDGSFGDNTQKQLEAFQTVYDLKVGLYDEMTKEALVTIRIESEAPKLGTHMVLVDKYHFLPSDFIPEDLRVVDVPSTREVETIDEVADQVEAMFAAAKAAGEEIYLLSGYRSYDYQEGIFRRRVNNYGFEEAEKVVAIPGESEHQTGLAIDVTTAEMNFDLGQSFDQTTSFDWLEKNCYKYGFILRYPKDKTAITGYIYEPWHFRYIGDQVLAKQLMESGMTLDEYYAN